MSTTRTLDQKEFNPKVPMTNAEDGILFFLSEKIRLGISCELSAK